MYSLGASTKRLIAPPSATICESRRPSASSTCTMKSRRASTSSQVNSHSCACAMAASNAAAASCGRPSFAWQRPTAMCDSMSTKG